MVLAHLLGNAIIFHGNLYSIQLEFRFIQDLGKLIRYVNSVKQCIITFLFQSQTTILQSNSELNKLF